MTIHHQHDRVNLATIKSCLKALGRNTNADSYNTQSYVIRVAREVIEKNKNKKNLTPEQHDALQLLKKRTPKKPRKAPTKVVL